MEVAKRNTQQKELIKRIVLDSCDHPTAETVYDRAKEEICNISLGTVYRVLKELSAAGEILEIPISDGKSRYDKTLFDHAHLICLKCGSVTDVYFDSAIINNALMSNDYKIEKKEIILKGLCKKCMEE